MRVHPIHGLLLALAIVAAAPAAARDAQGPIGADELTRRLDAGTAPAVLDVRSPEEFRAGHIPGAVNIPVQDLARRLGEIAGLREAELVVHCETGPRAQYADRLLRSAGFTDPRPLVGHMSAWRASGRPLTRPGCTRC